MLVNNIFESQLFRIGKVPGNKEFCIFSQFSSAFTQVLCIQHIMHVTLPSVSIFTYKYRMPDGACIFIKNFNTYNVYPGNFRIIIFFFLSVWSVCAVKRRQNYKVIIWGRTHTLRRGWGGEDEQCWLKMFFLCSCYIFIFIKPESIFFSVIHWAWFSCFSYGNYSNFIASNISSTLLISTFTLLPLIIDVPAFDLYM